MRIELDFEWGKNERTIRSSSSSFFMPFKLVKPELWWKEKPIHLTWCNGLHHLYKTDHRIFMQILAMKLVLNQNFCEFSGVFWLGPRSAFKRKEITIRQAYQQYDSKCIMKSIRNIYELKIRTMLFKWENCGEEATIIAKKLGK